MDVHDRTEGPAFRVLGPPRVDQLVEDLGLDPATVFRRSRATAVGGSGAVTDRDADVGPTDADGARVSA